MKTLATLTAFALLAAFATASAQPVPQAQPAPVAQYRGPDLAAQRAAMTRLAGMVGDWTGTAAVSFPEPLTVYQREHIESDLDGLLLVIHGKGYATDAREGAPIFSAFGVISYDDQRQIYEFRVYNDGRAATAEARFLDDGRLQWTMNFAPVIIRYTITLTDNHWNEVGEMSPDSGATWMPMVELNLDRVG